MAGGSGDTIRLYLTMDNHGAIRALKQVGDESSSTSRKIEDNNRRGSESFGRVHDSVGKLHLGMIALAGAGGLGLAAYGMTSVTRSAIGMQAQTMQLRSSLKVTGAAGAAAFNQMTTAASNMATRGGFAAQENVQALTQFVRISQNAAQATRMFSLATNVARGSHKDLLQVTRALALAEQGRLTGLARLGIAIPKGTTPQAAMNMLQARYGGATKAFSNSAAGGLSNLKQSWDVIKEDLGKAFLPLVMTLSKTLTGLMPSITRVLNSIITPIAAVLGKLLPPLVSVLNSVMPVVSAAISKLLPVIQAAFNVALPPLVKLFNMLLPVITTAVTQLLPPVAHIFASLMPPLVRTFQILAPPLMRALNTLVGAWGPIMNNLITGLTPSILMFVRTVAPLIPNLLTAIVPLVKSLDTVFIGLALLFVQMFVKVAPALTTALVKLVPAITLLANTVSSVLGAIPRLGGGLSGHGTNAQYQALRNKVRHDIGVTLPARLPGSNTVQRHAQGGVIGGYGPQDSVLSWMTPGEGVVTPKGMQRIGGESGLNTINAGGHMTSGQHDNRDVVINVNSILDGKIVAQSSARQSLRQVALS